MRLQVKAMAAAGDFEDAINLMKLAGAEADAAVERDVDLAQLHSDCGRSLLRKGDFEKAVSHFLEGGVDLADILQLLPDFLPPALQSRDGDNEVPVTFATNS